MHSTTASVTSDKRDALTVEVKEALLTAAQQKTWKLSAPRLADHLASEKHDEHILSEILITAILHVF